MGEGERQGRSKSRGGDSSALLRNSVSIHTSLFITFSSSTSFQPISLRVCILHQRRSNSFCIQLCCGVKQHIFQRHEVELPNPRPSISSPILVLALQSHSHLCTSLSLQNPLPMAVPILTWCCSGGVSGYYSKARNNKSASSCANWGAWLTAD